MFIILLGILVGVAAPFQTSVNNALQDRLKSPYLSTLGSFGGSLLIASIINLIVNHNIYLPLAEIAKDPWWIWTGGFWGFVLVVCGIISFPKLGSVQTIILTSLGQVISGLLLDHFGLLGAVSMPITTQKLAGTALVIGGVMCISNKKNVAGVDATPGEHSDNSSIWLYRALAFVAGVAISVQIAVNGRLGEIIGDNFRSTMMSMAVGTITTLLFVIALYLIKGRAAVIDDSRPDVAGKWWMWTGGFFGVFIVTGNVIIAQPLGTGFSTVLNIAGQMLGSIIIDTSGFLGIPKIKLTLRTMLGTVLIIGGIAIINGVI